jgi:Rhodopirellula transposase DDE domain
MQAAVPVEQYDIGANDGFVSVDVDHDTPVFAVASIEAWWKQVGEKRYPTRERSSSPPMQAAAPRLVLGPFIFLPCNVPRLAHT